MLIDSVDGFFQQDILLDFDLVRITPTQTKLKHIFLKFLI